MPERDYAAPLVQERRESRFNKLRPSSIWGHKPALTPALRENFPNLLRSHTATEAIPPVPDIPDAFRTDDRTAGVNEQYHSRTSSAQDRRPITQPGRYYQQPELRPANPSPSPQRDYRQPKTGQVAATSHLPPVHSSSPDWPFERPRAAPSPSARTPPPTYQEHLNSTHRRDTNGRLYHIPNQPHFPTLEQAVRRRRKQPSLRDQASRDSATRTQGSSSITGSDHSTTRNAAAQSSLESEVSRGHAGLIDDRNTRTPVFRYRNALPGYSGYSHFPCYSPTTEAHQLPPISRYPPAVAVASSAYPQARSSSRSFASRVQDRYHPTGDELQATTSSPADTSLSLNELREVEDVLAPLPVPAAPYSCHPSADRTESTTSIATSAATLGNRSSASRPLTFIETNFVGFANVVGFKPDQSKSKSERRGWKAKLVKCGKKVRTKAKEMWADLPRQYKILRCKIDVRWTGPLADCQCKVCMAHYGYDRDRTRNFHEVPKGLWTKTTPQEYHRLNWGEEANPRTWDADAPPRGLGAFRVGPCCEQVKYVTIRVDLDE